MRPSTKTQRALQGAARWIATSVVVVSPWLFASADPWAYLFLNSLAYIAGAAWLFSILAGAPPVLRAPGLSAVLLGLTGYVAIQMAPLPDSVVRALNPLAAQITSRTNELLAQVDAWRFLPVEFGRHVPATLSLSPAGTRRSVCLMLAYVSVFLVLLNTARHWHQLRRVAVAVVVSGFLMAVIGMAHKFSGSGEIFWFHVPRNGGSIFGAFTNRNHYAAYANLIFGLAFGLFFSSRNFRDVVLSGQWRDRSAWLSERRASSMALSVFAVTLLAGSVCVSLSRGGMLSLGACLGLFAVALVFRRGALARARSSVAAIVLLVTGAAVWLGSDPMLERLGSLRELASRPLEDFRAIVTRDTARMFSACPVFGSGFGTYCHVFSVFQTPSLKFRWLHAHNDWAQMFAEGGLVGAALFLLAVALWVRVIVREFPDARQRAKLFVVGALVGLGTIALHSLVDYSLHKPAVAFLLAGAAAMATAGVYLKPSEIAELEPAAAAASPAVEPRRWVTWPVRAAALAGVLGLTLLAGLQLQELRGELAFSRFLYFKRVSENAGNPVDLRRAVLNGLREADLAALWGRNDPDALSDISASMTAWELNVVLDRGVRVAAAEAASTCAGLAVCGAPSDYLSWLSLARSATSLAMWDEAEAALKRGRELVQHPREVRMFEVLEMGEELQIP